MKNDLFHFLFFRKQANFDHLNTKSSHIYFSYAYMQHLQKPICFESLWAPAPPVSLNLREASRGLLLKKNKINLYVKDAMMSH